MALPEAAPPVLPSFSEMKLCISASRSAFRRKKGEDEKIEMLCYVTNETKALGSVDVAKKQALLQLR